jgi:hypothetical protein
MIPSKRRIILTVLRGRKRSKEALGSNQINRGKDWFFKSYKLSVMLKKKIKRLDGAMISW